MNINLIIIISFSIISIIALGLGLGIGLGVNLEPKNKKTPITEENENILKSNRNIFIMRRTGERTEEDVNNTLNYFFPGEYFKTNTNYNIWTNRLILEDGILYPKYQLYTEKVWPKNFSPYIFTLKNGLEKVKFKEGNDPEQNTCDPLNFYVVRPNITLNQIKDFIDTEKKEKGCMDMSKLFGEVGILTDYVGFDNVDIVFGKK